MKKWLYILFIPVYFLITLFGLGPVLLADGTLQERLVTLLIVIIIYVIVTIVFVKLIKKFRVKS